jgi:hypothetical protein
MTTAEEKVIETAHAMARSHEHHGLVSLDMQELFQILKARLEALFLEREGRE